MHDDRLLIEARIGRILNERVVPAVHGPAVPLRVEVWHAPGEPVPVAQALDAPYRPLADQEVWGPAWGTSWFHVTGAVPAGWAGRQVEAVIDLGFAADRDGFSAEALVHRPDGTAVKGLNPRNTWVPIAGEAVDLYVEAAANPEILGITPTADGDRLTSGTEPLYRVRRIELAVFAEDVWELVRDVEVLDGLMRELPVGDPRRWNILRGLQRALDVALDLHDVAGTAAAARAELAPLLAAPAVASAHRVSAVGHAHIDSAWLWPVRETVRKVARTVANVTALMDDHPEFVFAMSSAQQWAWMRDHRPDLWERMREKVASGQLVPVGGMWVESDTNMPGGEALARQLVHGKRFFLDELGVETEEIWLPDSFGYTAAFPQLARLAGARWFLTQKISWSQFNKFPHHTFRWEGLDGSRVFTHFPPVDTYNAELIGSELGHLVRNYAEKGAANRSLVPFGHGDGGGGPTREMLGRASRLRDLEGSARVSVEAPSRFFAAAESEYPDAPVWAGELYLELHRATYTSQARNKQGNRRCEHLLYEAELWCTTAAVRVGHPYPYAELDRIWKTVLLHQFHDILPGTAIAWVHRESRATYEALFASLETIIMDALRALAGPGDQELVFDAATLSADVSSPASSAAAVSPLGDGHVLDNGLLRVVVDARGLVVSVSDLRADREVLAGPANLLQLHPDLPHYWDAWDVDHTYRSTVTDLVEVSAIHVVDGGVEVVRRFGSSSITQTITLPPAERRVEFTVDIDWHEREKFLKAAFPLDVHADRSTAETQFGHVHRPTHQNTSWDFARFEICAHRFLHVAEPGYGIALVNDSTYGHDVTRDGPTTTVRLSLLRAPRYPDPDTDQGSHTLRYALVPDAEMVDAVWAGIAFNLPERRVAGSSPVEPLVSVDQDGVIVSAVKLADDGSGNVVVRVYEALGGRARARLTLGFAASGVQTTDLLERPLPDGTAVPDADGAVALELRPFQILTLRFHRTSSAT